MALYLSHVLCLVPQPIVEDVSSFVRAQRMGGKLFLRLREADLDALGLNVRWRTLMMEAVRKLRRDCLMGRIWGFEGGSGGGAAAGDEPAPRAGAQGDGAMGHRRASSGASFDEGVRVAVQEAIAQWQASQEAEAEAALQRAASGSNRETLKRLRERKQVRGTIHAFEPSPSLPRSGSRSDECFSDIGDEEGAEGGFVAIGHKSSANLLHGQYDHDNPSQRGRRELGDVFQGQQGYVRERAQSLSSSPAPQHAKIAPLSTDTWSDTLSEDEAAALASELDEEELRRFADELEQFDAASNPNLGDCGESLISDRRRIGSETSADSSVEEHEAFTPSIDNTVEFFQAPDAGKQVDAHAEELEKASGALGLLPMPASSVVVAIATFDAPSSPRAPDDAPLAEPTRVAEEPVSSIGAHWDYSSPKFGTARLRRGLAPPLSRSSSQQADSRLADLPENSEAVVTMLADIAATSGETPVLMSPDEVKLVESLGLTARSQGTLGSRRSKGVAKLLRKQEAGATGDEASLSVFGSVRSRPASVRASTLETASTSRRAGDDIAPPSSIRSLFEVPEVKSPEVEPPSTFPSASQGEPSESVHEGEKLLVPLYTVEPAADGIGSMKKRSMVLVERARFESLARRMGALEDQLAELDSTDSSRKGMSRLQDFFQQHADEPAPPSPTSSSASQRIDQAIQSDPLSRAVAEHEADEDDEMEASAKPMLSIGAIPSYMLGLGAGVGFVILSEVLGKLAARR